MVRPLRGRGEGGSMPSHEGGRRRGEAGGASRSAPPPREPARREGDHAPRGARANGPKPESPPSASEAGMVAVSSTTQPGSPRQRRKLKLRDGCPARSYSLRITLSAVQAGTARTCPVAPVPCHHRRLSTGKFCCAARVGYGTIRSHSRPIACVPCTSFRAVLGCSVHDSCHGGAVDKP